MKDKHDHLTLELDLAPTFEEKVLAADKLNSKLPELTWAECLIRIYPEYNSKELRAILNRERAVEFAQNMETEV